ncbi:MAG: precorrin-6y C5,15-methyltransferase (decarboxylating) subunit CbiE [Fervidobacterium sp.]|nr:precorrin-6y C5,15-methyltransferase (decarboxylating) subunit CbiE [Fervidobacterium sp.]
MISIVGIGPGDLDYISNMSVQKILNADVLIGGKRHLDLFKDLKGKEFISYDSSLDLVKLLQNYPPEKKIVFLASGDPLLHGIFAVISKHIDKNLIEVIPGISAIQYLCSKVKVSTDNLITLSLHGKKLTEEFIQEMLFLLRKYGKVAAFTDSVNTPKKIVNEMLKSNDFTDFLNSCPNEIKLYIGEDLSYKNERIYEFKFLDFLIFPNDFSNLVTILITLEGR